MVIAVPTYNFSLCKFNTPDIPVDPFLRQLATWLIDRAKRPDVYHAAMPSMTEELHDLRGMNVSTWFADSYLRVKQLIIRDTSS